MSDDIEKRLREIDRKIDGLFGVIQTVVTFAVMIWLLEAGYHQHNIFGIGPGWVHDVVAAGIAGSIALTASWVMASWYRRPY